MRKLIMRKIIFLFLTILTIFGCVDNGEQIEANGSDQIEIATGIEVNGTVEINESNEVEEPIDLGNTSVDMDEENFTINNTSEGTKNKTLEGLVFGEGDYILVLDDLSLDKPEPCAIISIYDSNTQEQLEQAKICPGEEYYWTSPENHVYRIVVIETAAGYSYGAAWANIIIYG